jgi:phenylalanine-4-hydroxylase
MHTQKKLYDLHLQTFGNINDISKQLQYELKRISKLWDKTDEMHYTLFSKKEIMKLVDDEINDFNRLVNNEITNLMTQTAEVFKSETGGSNE